MGNAVMCNLNRESKFARKSRYAMGFFDFFHEKRYSAFMMRANDQRDGQIEFSPEPPCGMRLRG
jgi:hypothetical protein